LAEPEIARAVHGKAVWIATGALINHAAARAIEAHHRLGKLIGEPQRVAAIEEKSVRRAIGGNLVLHDDAAQGVELAEGGIAMAGIPDLAPLIGHPDEPRGIARKVPFPKGLVAGIEAGNPVAAHDGDENAAVVGHRSLARE